MKYVIAGKGFSYDLTPWLQSAHKGKLNMQESRGNFHFHSFQGSFLLNKHQKPWLEMAMGFLERNDG